MKARPRYVERETAEILTAVYKNWGMSEVMRIPVLGRTGPDFQINEGLLAIDVKSRKDLPKYFWQLKERKPTLFGFGDIVGVLMKDLHLLVDLPIPEDGGQFPPEVRRHLLHMAEWTADPKDAYKFLATSKAIDKVYLPAVICHKPGSHIANAIFVMFKNDLIEFRRNYKELNNGKTNTGSSARGQ